MKKLSLLLALSAPAYAYDAATEMTQALNDLNVSIEGVQIPQDDMESIATTIRLDPDYVAPFTESDRVMIDSVTTSLSDFVKFSDPIIPLEPTIYDPYAAKFCVERCTTNKDGSKTCWKACYEN